MLGRGQREGKISVRYYDPRDAADDAHRTVDGAPFGGGPGMVMKVGPLAKTIDAIKADKVILLTPTGKQFTQALARTWAHDFENLVLVAGHYEGVDARVKEIFDAEEISIGPYVLSGGELPAAVVIDAVARHAEGVLGDTESLEERRGFGIPQYTRPEVFEWKGKAYRVPDVLLSGNHAEIEKWRGKQAVPVDKSFLDVS